MLPKWIRQPNDPALSIGNHIIYIHSTKSENDPCGTIANGLRNIFISFRDVTIF